MRQQVRVAINEWLILAVIDSFMYCERGNKSLMSVRVVVNSLILSSRGKIAFLNAKLNRDRKSLDWNHRAKKKSCIVLKIHFCNFWMSASMKIFLSLLPSNISFRQHMCMNIMQCECDNMLHHQSPRQHKIRTRKILPLLHCIVNFTQTRFLLTILLVCYLTKIAN